MIEVFKGIDPSFKGLGLSEIDLKHKTLTFDEFSVDIKHGAFAEVSLAADEMIKILDSELFWGDSIVGMEIPPVNGFYAVKLWALDSKIYCYLNGLAEEIWLFNVPYLKFINGKDNTKKDTMKIIDDIIDIFKCYDFKIVQHITNKKGKPKKLTSNQCDSFLYCIRVFVRYSLENGKNAELVQDILNINERFAVEKETVIGKKIENK